MNRNAPPKFKNDQGLPVIRIGVRELMCAGASAPHDHPHVYLDMGDVDTIVCPYCSTVFRLDPGLGPLEADPPDSFFVDEIETD